MNTIAGETPPIERAIERVRQTYGRWNRHTSVEQMRLDWDELFWADLVPCVKEDIEVDGLHLRWIDAEGAGRERVLIYFHGGGYKMGSVVSHHDLMARLSLAAKCRVLGVNYRLIPEYGFPSPVEDAVRAYRWLIEQGIDPSHIAFAGDSAGGGLVAAALIALREQGARLPAAGVMISAWTDLEATGPSYQTRAQADPIHQRPMILALARQYVGDSGDPRHPLASPLNDSLSGLPPLLLQVGDRETGLDDSTRFAEKARHAGVEVELEVWDGMIHVFHQFANELPEARQAIAKIGTFLNRHWSAM
jgi:epsilon-lactone hydrolase